MDVRTGAPESNLLLLIMVCVGRKTLEMAGWSHWVLTTLSMTVTNSVMVEVEGMAARVGGIIWQNFTKHSSRK